MNAYGCTNATSKGNCQCVPKCLKCGFGPHMAAHMKVDGRSPDKGPYHEFTVRSFPYRPQSE